MRQNSGHFYFITIFFVLLISVVNCSQTTHPKEISEDKFVMIYCDVISFSDLIQSKSRPAFIDSVLTHYNVTREDFEYTIKIYSKDTEKWENVFKKVVAELEKRVAELDKKDSETQRQSENKK